MKRVIIARKKINYCLKKEELLQKKININAIKERNWGKRKEKLTQENVKNQDEWREELSREKRVI